MSVIDYSHCWLVRAGEVIRAFCVDYPQKRSNNYKQCQQRGATKDHSIRDQLRNAKARLYNDVLMPGSADCDHAVIEIQWSMNDGYFFPGSPASGLWCPSHRFVRETRQKNLKIRAFSLLSFLYIKNKGVQLPFFLSPFLKHHSNAVFHSFS